MLKATERAKKDLVDLAGKLENSSEEKVGQVLDKGMAFILVHRAAIIRFISGLLVAYGGMIRVFAGFLKPFLKPLERFIETVEEDPEILSMVRDFEKVLAAVVDAPKPDTEEPATTTSSDAPPAK